MKKYILAIGIALGCLNSVQAQEITFGVKAGPQLSGFLGNISESKSIVTAFGGVYANIELSEKIFLQPELLYSFQGAKSSMKVGGLGLDDYADLDERIDLSYINIPIMFQYAVTKNARLEIGPQLGIRLKAEGEGEITVISGFDEGVIKEIIDLKENTEAIDLGLNVGGVYMLDNGLNFTLRYSLGLRTIGKTNDMSDFLDTLHSKLQDSKNSVLSLGIGYTF